MALSAVQEKRNRLGNLTKYRPLGSPEIIEARRELAEAKITAYVSAVLADAPQLSVEQRDRLALLLRPSP